MWWSWVAISTVVPVRLMRSRRSMISRLVSGSRLPVGSSAISSSGRFTNARAMATRCCSPPESSAGIRLALPESPTMSSTSGTTFLMTSDFLPITSSAKATLSNTVFCCSSRKSWKTQPMTCRSLGICRPDSLLTWNFDTWISPEVGASSAISSRMKVDLPEPDGPMRKTNSPLPILRSTLSSAGRVDALYCLVTWSRVIITARQSSPSAPRDYGVGAAEDADGAAEPAVAAVLGAARWSPRTIRRWWSGPSSKSRTAPHWCCCSA